MKESDNVSIIISLYNNHNNNINHAIAECGASAIEKQHFNNAVANPDIPGRLFPVNLASEINRSDSLVAPKKPKVPKSAQKFFYLSDRILLYVWEISDWGN